MPTSVRPCRSISGIAAASSPRAVTRIVCGLGGRTRERVRSRRAREVAEAQPQHDGAPDAPGGTHPPSDAIDRGRPARRRRPPATSPRAAERTLDADRAPATARLHAAGHRGCAPAHADDGPMPARAATRAPPRRADATSPTVAIPRAWSFATSPARHPRAAPPATDAETRARHPAARRAARPAWPRRSPPWRGTSSLPRPPSSGARPARAHRPAAARRSRRGDPNTRSIPRTSRNASSIDSPSTSGVVSPNTPNTARSPPSRPSSAARPRRPAGTGAGPALRSWPCGCRTPWPRSSPPARPTPPTITGGPRRRGSSRCSTDAKNASSVGVQDGRLSGHERMFASLEARSKPSRACAMQATEACSRARASSSRSTASPISCSSRSGCGSQPGRTSPRGHPKGSQKTPEPPKTAPLFDPPTQA